MFKKEKVVMLPTNEKAENCLVQYYNRKISFNKELLTESYRKAAQVICYHLYVISNGEKPKIGDWYYIYVPSVHSKNDPNCIAQLTKEDVDSGLYEKYKDSIKKIIATTDSSLTKVVINGDYPVDGIPLPKPSQSFIEKYIECYNKGEIIDDVLVEYTYDNPEPNRNVLCLKINSKDNTITIKKIKNSWNREEVVNLLQQFNNEKPGVFDCSKWIKENL